MAKLYYREQALEGIARKALCSYDPGLYYGLPTATPIEEMIEAHGLSLEYQHIRNDGRILGETVFDDGLHPIYDMEHHEYILIPVHAGTIFIDASLCIEAANTGRFRFTCAHELAHWILHKQLYLGTGKSAALAPAMRETDMETQANMLASMLLMPMPQVKRCFYHLHSGRRTSELVDEMAEVFQVSRQAMRIRLENHHLL